MEESSSSSFQQQQQQHPQQQDSSSSLVVSFQEGVTDIMMVTEELKQSLPDPLVDDLAELQRELHCLESIVERLDFLFRLALDEPGDDVRKDLCLHCGQRASNVAEIIFRRVTTTKKPKNDKNKKKTTKELIDFGGAMEGQGAIARIAELSIMIHGIMYELQHNNNTTNDKEEVPPCQEIDQIIEAYSVYQRQLLRQRSKPAIAQLAEWRQNGGRDACPTMVVPNVTAVQVEEDEHGTAAHNDNGDTDGGGTDTAATEQPHTHAITVILGQGSGLLHPLLVWQQQVPPESPVYRLCQSAIAVLDEQSQTLTKTVAEWFLEDRHVDDWMVRAASGDQAPSPPLDGTSSNGGGGGGGDHAMTSNPPDLAELDSLLEEMSFCCQLLIRYQRLVHHFSQQQQQQEQGDGINNNNNTISPPKIVADELVPEWTWKYAALERYLSTHQWQYALRMACPVDIIVGMPVRVPSIVEDAMYLSTRALERAASTLSIQAMGTVAHSISHDIWSTDNDNTNNDHIGNGEESKGMYESLIQLQGCLPVEEGNIGERDQNDTGDITRPPQSGNSNAFASALLDALDDDLGHANTSAQSHTKISSPPSSLPSVGGGGGILGISALASSLTKGGQYQQEQQQLRLDSQLCNLNGIHSASVACISMENLLESQLEEDYVNNGGGDSMTSSSATSMIELAREELIRYSKSYEQLLLIRTQDVLVEWCGSPHSNAQDTNDTSSSRGGTLLRSLDNKSSNKALDILHGFFQTELYRLDSTQFARSETDERLESSMITPLQESHIVQNLEKCNDQVTSIICQELSSMVANLVLHSLWGSSSSLSLRSSSLYNQSNYASAEQQQHQQQGKQFTDWGSLLLSKQMRLLQNFLCSLLAAASEESYNTVSLMDRWERLSQVVLCLGLDSVSDWYSYQSTSCLTLEELEKTLKLRVDFDPKAVAAVVSKVKEEEDSSIINNQKLEK